MHERLDNKQNQRVSRSAADGDWSEQIILWAANRERIYCALADIDFGYHQLYNELQLGIEDGNGFLPACGRLQDSITPFLEQTTSVSLGGNRRIGA